MKELTLQKGDIVIITNTIYSNYFTDSSTETGMAIILHEGDFIKITSNYGSGVIFFYNITRSYPNYIHESRLVGNIITKDIDYERE